MTDARHHHSYPEKRLKQVLFLALLTFVMAGCQSKQTTYNFSIEQYQGFNAKNDFLTATPLSRLASLDDMGIQVASSSHDDVLSKNLFDMTPASCPPTRLATGKSGGSSDQLLRGAFALLGTRYRSGGDNPSTGFDCSGFTTWVFNKYGINLPRSSREQFQVGRQVAKSGLKKGDLVFFGSKRGISHVGIYLENGKFIHSASNGKTVQVSSLEEDYWKRRYAGGRRVF
ncbi:MAG: C40 family peptidase [Desulfovibrionaceae bacterium]|nr:C40 family peptidase [Desulfovibrionaceae bacterium]